MFRASCKRNHSFEIHKVFNQQKCSTEKVLWSQESIKLKEIQNMKDGHILYREWKEDVVGNMGIERTRNGLVDRNASQDPTGSSA